LVVFADDLQWADIGSLRLLRIMADAVELPFLMLLVAFRPAEVESDESVRGTIESLRAGRATTTTLELPSLDLEAASQLCREALRCEREPAKELAKVLLRKTAGNPFFIKRLLRFLHQSRSLAFAVDVGAWHWDLARVDAVDVPDDVVDLFVSLLRSLPDATQRTLEIAACLGRSFSPALLAHFDDQSPDAVAVNLGAGVREGLLVPLAPTKCPEGPGPWFRFAHDRVQQAADSLLHREEREQIHLRVGRKLADELSEDESGDRLFEAVAHLDRAADRIVDAGERLHLAELNARAAARASASSVYASALDLLKHAMALLPEDAWRAHHELAFSLHRHAIECSYLTGNPALGERLFHSALEHVEAPLEKAALYDVRVVASTLVGDFEQAVAWGAKGLALTGVELPSSGDIEHATSKEVAAVEATLDGRPVEALLDAPPMRAPEPIMAVQILSNLFAPTYFGRQDLYPFVVARTVNLILAHGLSKQAPFALVGYGVILPWFTEGYERARAFGLVGVDLSRRLGNPAIECRALGLFGTFVNNWRAPMGTSVPMLREAMKKGLESGELQYALYWGLAISKNLLCQGVELSRFIGEVDNLLAIGRRTKMRAGVEWQLPFRQVARCLQGRTRGRDRLDDDDFDEAAYVESVRGSPYALSLYESARLQILFLGGYFEAARAQSESARERLPFQRSTPAVVDHELYSALAMAACPGDERGRAISAIEDSLKKLETWARHAPENWRHKQLLVAAELERLRGRPSTAAALYDDAIDTAARERFTRDEALAYELAGRFYRALGRRRIAASYLASAITAYRRWGATAKAAALEDEFPSLPFEVPSAHERREVVPLDQVGILRAAEAMASVVELDRLLETLMDLCLSTAGAERGAMLLIDDDGPFVRVSGSIGEAAALERTPLVASTRVPTHLIGRVRETGEALVLADASRDGAFVDDPYIVRHSVRSALAQPIRKQARLVGVLYLENNLASGVFGPERLQVLQLLSSLMAISLENGLLFERMTLEVRERRLLADVGSALVESLDHDAIVERVTRLVVPQLGDCCIVDVVEDGTLRPVAAARDDAGRAPPIEELRPQALHLGERCLHAGRSILWAGSSGPFPDDTTERHAHTRALRSLGVLGAMTVPLVASGTTTGVLTLFSSTRRYEPRDLTLTEELARRAALAMQNARLHEQTLETVRMREEFLAIASHELYTPMTSLVLATQHLTTMAESGRIDASQVTRLTTTTARQAARLQALVAKLLDVATLTRGGPFLEPCPVELRALAQRVVTDLQPEFGRAKCDVRVDAPTPVQGTWDATRLEQVMINLLSNAMKFGAGKPIDIAVARIGDRARLSVRDRGIGIEVTQQAHIFERFERAVSPSQYGGLGLGLYICRRIVEAHSGRIRVESQPGAGATFVVELPMDSRISSESR
jgi:predicted ATPase/signal transduction histidine kinase